MLFCGSNFRSAVILHQAIEEFSALSGLSPNKGKSCIYLAGNDQVYNRAVVDLFQFSVGSLPVRYLGVPLITTKLKEANYKPLIDGITSRIRH